METRLACLLKYAILSATENWMHKLHTRIDNWTQFSGTQTSIAFSADEETYQNSFYRRH